MDTTTNDADALRDAGKILSDYCEGKAIAGTIYRDRQSTIVVASALLAIAVEVRRLTNLLGDLTDGQEAADGVTFWGGAA